VISGDSVDQAAMHLQQLSSPQQMTQEYLV
jgi:hypothetical protein